MPKPLVILVVALVVIGGAILALNKLPKTGNNNNPYQSSQPTESVPMSKPIDWQSGNTDADLDKDSTQINSQIDALGADTSSADKSLNDQPVPQGQ